MPARTRKPCEDARPPRPAFRRPAYGARRYRLALRGSKGVRAKAERRRLYSGTATRRRRCAPRSAATRGRRGPGGDSRRPPPQASAAGTPDSRGREDESVNLESQSGPLTRARARIRVCGVRPTHGTAARRPERPRDARPQGKTAWGSAAKTPPRTPRPSPTCGTAKAKATRK